MKLASGLLTASIGLCSVGALCGAGCADREAGLPSPPVILNLPECQEPNDPDLVPVDGDLPFDAPENVKAFLERDDEYRLYYRASQSAFACYRRILGKEEKDNGN